MTDVAGRLDEMDLLDGLGLAAILSAHGLVCASRVTAVPGADPDEWGGSVAEIDDSPWEIERALVAEAVPARRAEFFAGRAAARAALAELGLDPAAIGRRPDRSPDWPPGVIGSLSHIQGLVAAVVACPDSTGRGIGRELGIGIDVEVDRPLPAPVVDRVMGPVERAGLGADAERDGVLVFSAKEAVFKALNPRTGRWLEFEDVTVRLWADGQAPGGAFEAQLSPDGRGPADPSRVRGRWLRAGRVVATGCLVETVDLARPAAVAPGGGT